MNKFLIYTNPNKDKDLSVSNKVREYLSKKGASVYDELSQCEDASNVMMLVLGGDGTMLRAIRDNNFFDGPVIGINMGTLGFLTEIEMNSLYESLDRLLADDFKIEDRMLLEGFATGDKTWALNDVVLARCGGLQIINFEISVNNQPLLNYEADGIIISTPTGSTGYNLSAGGPIASPAAQLIMLTPICPHSLNHRSIILSGQDEVSIKVTASREGREQVLELNFDGNVKETVKTGDEIIIKKGDKTVKFAKLGKDSFLQVLNRKMSDQ